MRKFVSIFLAVTLISGFANNTALAENAAKSEATPEEVLARLKTLYPSTKFASVKLSPIAGVYEVVMGRNVAYFDSTGRYALFGNIFDVLKQEDLTEPVRANAARLDFKKLPFNDAIKTVRGNGKKIMAVFSDPECPYCKTLEPELAKLNDVTIYTFLLPMFGQEGTAFEKAAAVWCSSDRSDAWKKLMATGKITSAVKDCDVQALNRNKDLAARSGIRGTPILVNETGRILMGAVDWAQLEAFLLQRD